MKTIAEQLKITEFPFRIGDSRGNVIYREDSNKFWMKREYDELNNDNVIYFENSDGLIIDTRSKSIPEYTMEELTKIVGKEFKIKKS